MSKLQKFLWGNALFSLTSGLVLIIWAKSLSHIFEVPASMPFWITGLALLGFAAWVLAVARWQNHAAIRSVILQDLAWVLASGIILIMKPWGISESGHQIIGLVAVLVLFFGLGQSVAFAQEVGKKQGIKQFRVQRVLPYGKSQVWPVVSDVAHYHRVAPNIDSVEIISGEGEGMLRACSHGKESWTETCLAWEEESKYVFEVNTGAPDYPYPFKYLRGTWRLKEVGEHSTEVQMIFDIQLKSQWRSLLYPIMCWRFRKICEEIFDNWEEVLRENHNRE